MGGQSPLSPLNREECFSLKKFQEETPKKMTLHILSNNISDCISLVEYLTGEKFPPLSNELLEVDIIKKINLFSFMNYKIYEDTKKLMIEIKKISHEASENCDNIIITSINNQTQRKSFAEVVIILDNEEINEQIEIIKDEIKNDNILNTNPYYTPFFIFLSPNNLDISEFIDSKRFLYKIKMEDIINLKEDLMKFINKNQKKEELMNFDEIKEEKIKLEESSHKTINIKDNNTNEFLMNENTRNKIENNKEILEFLNKLHVLFSYYNELGDIFSFINSKNEEVIIKTIDDMDITAFINILMLGRTGAGKSTLINLLLDEKKSIEGGTGFSTTSKNIKVYQKSGIPLRFYDVKGIEDQETLNNYLNLLKNYGENNKESIDHLNAIFFCMEYVKNKTIILSMEEILFEELVKLEIPIFFIITKYSYNPKKKAKSDKQENAREEGRNVYKKAINQMIKSVLSKIKKTDEECDKFINDYVRLIFVNLIKDSEDEIPPFGIDQIISLFSEKVSKEDWDKLEKCCREKDEILCKKYCENNPFLKYYSNFQIIKEINRRKALRYLKGLKAGAFFSGMVPGLDIGMEYYYRNLFKKKLKHLYGYDFAEAKKNMNEVTEPINKINFENTKRMSVSDLEKMNIGRIVPEDPEDLISLAQSEKKIKKKISKEVTNKGRNTLSIIGQAGNIGGGIITQVAEVSARFAITETIQIASWFILPVTAIAFGSLSCFNIHRDCNDILDIFEKAYYTLKFDTLLAYVKSFRKAINYLEDISKKIIKDNEDDETNE